MTDENIRRVCDNFSSRYRNDVSTSLTDEVTHIKAIHEANFGACPLEPLQLLNKIVYYKLDELFSNACIALSMFCTLPVTVASAELSFSKLKLIKNYLSSTMAQVRLSSLATISIETDLARRVDFRHVIDIFAMKKARRVKFS